MDKKVYKPSLLRSFWAFYRRAKFILSRELMELGSKLAFHDINNKNLTSIINVYYGQYNTQWDNDHKQNAVISYQKTLEEQIIIDKKVNYETNFVKNVVSKYQFFDVYFGKNTKKPQKTIFYIHGGSWACCDKKVYSYYCRHWAEDGYTVININYRLIPNVDIYTCINDCETAIKTAIGRKKEYFIDPTKIFLIGDSAGAHLCSMISAKHTNDFVYLGKNVKIRGLGLYYGVYDFTDIKYDKSPILKNFYKYFHDTNPLNYDDFVKSISPTLFVNDKFPPSFLTSGLIDKLHSQSEKFALTLKKNNVEFKTLFFPAKRKDARHAFLNFEMLASSKKAKEELDKFFKKVLRKKKK